MRSESIFSIAVFACSAYAALSADKLSSNLDNLTSKISTATDDAKKIRVENFSTAIPAFGDAYQELATAERDIYAALQGDKYTDAEQAQICTAFSTSDAAHRVLLQYVIGKHGIISLTPFNQVVAAQIRTDENLHDELAFGIIDIVLSCADKVKKAVNSLNEEFNDAITAYDN